MATKKKPKDEEIEKLVSVLNISWAEALEVWACDNDEEVNEEQTALDNKAKAVKVDHDITNKSKGEKKVCTHKTSDEKITLFDTVFTALAGFAPTIEKPHQTIAVVVGDKSYSINFVEHRKK